MEEIGKITTDSFGQPLPAIDKVGKEDLGECAVESCLMLIGLEEPKYFKHYPRSTQKKGPPEFSDGKVFGIVVKNLSLKSKVKPAWIDQDIKLRFSGKFSNLPIKVAVIFGGNIDPKAIDRSKASGIIPITYPTPVDYKNCEKVFWRIKDRLLEIDQFRRTVITKHGYHRPRLFPKIVIFKGKCFLEISTDFKEGKTVVTTFSRNGKQACQWIDPIH